VEGGVRHVWPAHAPGAENQQSRAPHHLPRKYPDATRDGIRDVLLRNHAKHADGAVTLLAPDDDRHHRVLLPEPGNHPERHLVFEYDDEVALCEGAERNARIALAELLAADSLR
jgi:hypothetical protein